jgi:hypothetical protein
MARRRQSSAIVRTIPVRSPAPIIRIAAPRAAPAKKHHRRRGRGGSSALTPGKLVTIAVGGAALGFIQKTFPNLPTLPIVGKSGTITILAYFASKHGFGFARDIAVAGAAISGYQLGLAGKISGDVMGDVMGEEV